MTAPDYIQIIDAETWGFIRTTVPRAKDSFARITKAIAALGQGRWPAK